MTGERSAERVRVDAFVKIHGDAGQELVFRTRDLSEHGLFLYTQVAHAYPLRVGSTLEIELANGEDPVACRVVVARIVDANTPEAETFPTGFGVRIVELTDDARAQLRGLIARIKAG